MANIIIPRPFDELQRRHAIAAINILIQRGGLDRNISYDFDVQAGKTYVRFWLGDLHQAALEGRVAHVSLAEVCAAPSVRPAVLEGIGDSF